MDIANKLSIAAAGLVSVIVGLMLLQQAWVVACCVGAAGAAFVWYLRRSLAAYRQISSALRRLADGDLSQPRLTVEDRGQIGAMATSINQLLTQLRLLSEEAWELAQGTIGVQHHQEKVLKTGQLSAVDLPTSSSQGDLNRSFAQLTNQLRRLTVKAHIIANDQLFNPALDEELPGELGDAFGLMVDNLRNFASHAKKISGGDLSTQIDGEGDLTDTFNEMVLGLRMLVEQMSESALQVATSTEEMFHVLREHEDSARAQAARIDETRRTVSVLFQSSEDIAENARQVYRDAEETCEKNRQIAQRIEELTQQSERITHILELITEIADRSDLLALNAGLEGTRSGTSGKGFSLVAEEMRRLAENTKGSVDQIREVVDEIQRAARKTAQTCKQGVALSEQTTETAMNIKVVTGRQRENTGQVNQTIEELSERITRDVTGTRQVRVTASELAKLSEALRTLVDRFDLGNGANVSEGLPSKNIAMLSEGEH